MKKLLIYLKFKKYKDYLNSKTDIYRNIDRKKIFNMGKDELDEFAQALKQEEKYIIQRYLKQIAIQ